MNRSRRKYRRRKSYANKVADRSDSISNDSTLGPLASSSPKKKSKSDQEDTEEMFNTTLKDFKEKHEKLFDDFISSIDPELLAIPFNFSLECFDMMMKGCASNQQDDSSMEPENSGFNEFKVPSLLAIKKDKSHTGASAKPHSSSSHSVHWDASVENNSLEEDVFKTPFKKKKDNSILKKTTEFKTPNVTKSNKFAVVTPGPLMQRNVRVLRVPNAGETAVSLGGSPLLVTPLNNTGGPQVTVSLPDVGRLMTIIPPEPSDDGMSPQSDHLFSDLKPDTKSQLKNLAAYLLKNIE